MGPLLHGRLCALAEAAPVVQGTGEAVAAVVWFFAVTWVCWKTRQPIDAITVHATTNLALGAYVLATGAWWLL
jgi:hypothetical protein